MSQTIPNFIQRTISLTLTGASVGISFTTLFVESRTQNKLLGRLVEAAKFVALLTCILALCLNLKSVNDAFENTLGKGSIMHIPEMAAYFTSVLLTIQVYYGIVGYLLIHRISSIVPWAKKQERFIPIAFAFLVVLVLVPAICACVTLGQSRGIFEYLVNPIYNRVYKVAFSIQSLSISAVSVIMDLFILHAIAKMRVQLNAADKKLMARLRKQMIIIGVTAAATMVELSVRIFALTATYVSIDFYIKILCISLDTYAFTSLGVCLSDVLTKKKPSESKLPKGKSLSMTASSGGNSRAGPPSSSPSFATNSNQL